MTVHVVRRLMLACVALGLAACGPTAPPSPAAPTSAPTTRPATTAVRLPADAAPLDQQVLVMAYDSTADFTTLDFYESVYKRAASPSTSDLLTEPLVRVN